MKMQNAKCKMQNGGRVAVVAAAMIVSPVYAELPGLPTTQPAGSAEQARPGEARPVVVAQGGPVRGSLFKQGASRRGRWT